MQKIIGVRFKKAGKIHFFDPGHYELSVGDAVIVDTPHGLESATVVIGIREIPVAEIPSKKYCPAQEIKRIHRKATRADLLRIEDNHKREKRAFDICNKKIQELKLPMNLISAGYTFDTSKVTFYFTANTRVDFRTLVKDLTQIFRSKIELRQVGVRDEAKLLGGIGCCGRPLCCANFLGDFASVSIRMAKEQNMSLNPTKISGICGRLLCCLKYESDYYHQAYMENIKNFQFQTGSRVIWSDSNGNDSEGKILSVNAVRKTASILLTNNKNITANWSDLMPLDSEDVNKIVEEQKADDDVNVEVDDDVEVVEKAASVPKRRERKERPRRSEKSNRRHGVKVAERPKPAERIENLYGVRSNDPPKRTKPPRRNSGSRSKKR